MIFCRFVSSDASQINEHEFDAVGQRVGFSEERFVEAIAGGAAFIPEKQFQDIGFTADELAAHGPVGKRDFPPESFCNKLLKAQQVFRDFHTRILEGGQHQVLAEIAASQGE